MCAKNSGVHPRPWAGLTGAKHKEVPEGEDFVLFAHSAPVAAIRTVEPIPVQATDVLAICHVEAVVLHAPDVLAIGFVEAVALHTGLKGAVAQIHALARNPQHKFPGRTVPTLAVKATLVLTVVRIEALGRRGECDGQEDEGNVGAFHRGKVLLPDTKPAKHTGQQIICDNLTRDAAQMLQGLT